MEYNMNHICRYDMKRYIVLLLSLLLTVSIALFSCDSNTDSSESSQNSESSQDDIDPDNIIIGTPLSTPSYTLQLSSADTYTPGEELVITIKVKNITVETGFVFYNLFLYYDKDKVDPVVKNDGDLNENMGTFLKVAPDIEHWEGISRLEEEESRYDLSFFTTYDLPSKEDDSFVVEIPFKVKAEVDGTITFTLPHGQGSAMDYPLNEYKGNGSSIDINKG